MQRKNTVLKVLILLGLLAILLSSYVQYGIPYLAEQEKEKNDERRIADLDALEAHIHELLVASSTVPLGNPNTVYISIPSLDPTCSNLSLPSLPDGWSYHCAPSVDFTNSDGTGWLPINFDGADDSGHSNILKNVGMLVVDPINSAATLNYYAFVASSTAASTTEYVLTAVLDSKKYLTEKAQTDGGSDPIRYEVGNDRRMWAHSLGLVTKLDTTNVDVDGMVEDLSGNNRNGVFYVSPSETGDFASENFVYIPNSNGWWFKKLTIRAVIKLNSFASGNNRITEKARDYKNRNWIFEVTPSGSLSFIADGQTTGPEGISLVSRRHLIEVGPTYNVGITYDGVWIKLFINGSTVAKKKIADSPAKNNIEVTVGKAFDYGPRYFDGIIKEFEIYDRALNAQELQRATEISGVF